MPQLDVVHPTKDAVHYQFQSGLNLQSHTQLMASLISIDTVQ